MGFFAKLKDKLFNKKVKEEVKSKYVSGLDKSRKNFVDKLAELKARYTKIDEDYFEELEQILILSDVGVHTALNIVEATRQEVKLKGITDPSAINEIFSISCLFDVFNFFILGFPHTFNILGPIQ